MMHKIQNEFLQKNNTEQIEITKRELNKITILCLQSSNTCNFFRQVIETKNDNESR